MAHHIAFFVHERFRRIDADILSFPFRFRSEDRFCRRFRSAEHDDPFDFDDAPHDLCDFQFFFKRYISKARRHIVYLSGIRFEVIGDGDAVVYP